MTANTGRRNDGRLNSEDTMMDTGMGLPNQVHNVDPTVIPGWAARAPLGTRRGSDAGSAGEKT
jgi:hypothetical protein